MAKNTKTPKVYEYRIGKVPGPGRSYRQESFNPGEGVVRVQIQDELNLSNVKVVSKVIEKLGIRPIYLGSFSAAGYNNGGSGSTRVEPPYFSRKVIPIIQKELKRRSKPTARPKWLNYYGVEYWIKKG